MIGRVIFVKQFNRVTFLRLPNRVYLIVSVGNHVYFVFIIIIMLLHVLLQVSVSSNQLLTRG